MALYSWIPSTYLINLSGLLKVPHQYFNNVEQIINKKNKLTEKRFLMLTSLFFLLFSYEVGYLNYSNLRLIFWGSIFSIYGIKRKELIS